MRTTKRLAVSIVVFLLFLLSGELIMRLRGVTPFSPQKYQVVYEPSFVFSPDQNLGYILDPGEFKFTMLPLDSLSFYPRHEDNHTRATRPSHLTDSFSKHQSIGIFGASFTYGVGVEDSMTYPWRLQEKLTGYNIINYAVPGYGPIHTLLMLQDMAENGTLPSLVILAYSNYHDNTNTLSRRSRENITRFANLNNTGFIERAQAPYCRMDKEGKLLFSHRRYDSFYTEWPLRRHSSLVNLLEIKYNEWESQQHNDEAVSKLLLDKIAAICRNNSVGFLILGMNNHHSTPEVLQYFGEKNIRTLDLSIDLQSTDKFKIHPKDAHPNTLAHEYYAKTLFDYLSKEKLVSTY